MRQGSGESEKIENCKTLFFGEIHNKKDKYPC
jgi:hypothetical protein